MNFKVGERYYLSGEYWINSHIGMEVKVVEITKYEVILNFPDDCTGNYPIVELERWDALTPVSFQPLNIKGKFKL